ncbi:MAG TPA: hypothetical protein PKB14_08040 [Rubrivivax sp.]|nr:hypothetical protein [Rubrivivax sp.]
MTDSSLSAYPPAPLSAPRAASSLWTPGVRLMRRLPLRIGLPLLWLGLWLPLLPALWLLGWLAPLPDAWRAPALGLLGLAGLASLYLLVCAGKALSQRLAVLHGEARQRDQQITRRVRELAEAREALQLQQQEIRGAIDETARRTLALSGLLDAGMQDADRADADLEAIQDEERNALQLMAALRARLLTLAQHAQALAEAARQGAGGGADQHPADTLSGAASAELTQCHQLSERIGGAERLNERRIESMRRATDRLHYRAERGLGEAQQLMALTRQVQAAQAASAQRLQRMATLCAALDAPDVPPAAANEGSAAA